MQSVDAQANEPVRRCQDSSGFDLCSKHWMLRQTTRHHHQSCFEKSKGAIHAGEKKRELQGAPPQPVGPCSPPSGASSARPRRPPSQVIRARCTASCCRLWSRVCTMSSFSLRTMTPAFSPACPEWQSGTFRTRLCSGSVDQEPVVASTPFYRGHVAQPLEQKGRRRAVGS
jgi:hypothetical protein